MNKLMKVAFGLIFIILIIATGFTFVVREGSGVIVSRFGAVQNVKRQAGLHFKLPAPIDRIIQYDTRYQYMDSGYIELLTQDMINVILQSYLVWNIADLELFHTSIGDYEVAQRHLNDLIANTKNGVLGNYLFVNLISTELDNIKLEEITQTIEAQVRETALNNFGINIESLQLKRISLPNQNIQSIFTQMSADRQRFVSGYLAEGERDAAILLSEARAQAASIISQGRLEASEIDAETERLVAQLYAGAYDQNPELFEFLQNLIALENAVNHETSIIMRASESPFYILTQGAGGN